jgi:cobalt-zinc-cadmium efflux system outer membrane protein
LAPEALPAVFTRAAAVRWALEYNPEIVALREQHNIAAAGVVIARTYPYNPIWEDRIQQASGPASATITNQLNLEDLVLQEIEIRGQRIYRQQAAAAALSRTDWEIAYQEELLGIRVLRAFNTVVYRQEKLRLARETLDLLVGLEKQVDGLRGAGKLTTADWIVARTEVDLARAVLGTGQASLVSAEYDFRRTLGLINEPFALQGALPRKAYEWDVNALMKAALAQRPDLQAHKVAVGEADARLELQIRDRYGNPTIGAAFAYDPTRTSMGGIQVNVPLPVFNTHRGDILQRAAERARAGLELRQIEVLVQQDVQNALNRIHYAQQLVVTYETQVLPKLEDALKQMRELFGLNQVDILRLNDVRRKLLQARDSYLDILWELSQAQADLAAAVADVAVAIGP